eukprot:5140050-Alexandrium_andersonii.AAC.1
MSASLVGSEMCIRDRADADLPAWGRCPSWVSRPATRHWGREGGRVWPVRPEQHERPDRQVRTRSPDRHGRA